MKSLLQTGSCGMQCEVTVLEQEPEKGRLQKSAVAIVFQNIEEILTEHTAGESIASYFHTILVMMEGSRVKRTSGRNDDHRYRIRRGGVDHDYCQCHGIQGSSVRASGKICTKDIGKILHEYICRAMQIGGAYGDGKL